MTKRTPSWLVCALSSAALGLALGCPQRARHAGDASEAPGIVAEERSLGVALPQGNLAEVGAELLRPSHVHEPVPAVLFVPGGGRASRRGTQLGDGAHTYTQPVDVTARWAEAMALAGYLTLSWDKRTCGPKDDPRCLLNPTVDLDREGPAALARDVDAACALMRTEPGFDGRIVLFAHGAGVAPTLASACAKEATALVLAAPIPRRVDEVMVAGLQHRAEALARDAKAGTPLAEALIQRANQLRNAAASLKETFASLEGGAFTEDARVQGVTLAFWRGWISLTDETPARLRALSAPRILLLGERDLQYAPDDRRSIRAFEKLEGVSVLQLDGADHNLLTEEALAEGTQKAVLEALEQALTPAAPRL